MRIGIQIPFNINSTSRIKTFYMLRVCSHSNQRFASVSNALAINLNCVHIPHVWNWVSDSIQLHCPTLVGEGGYSSLQVWIKPSSYGGDTSPHSPRLPLVLTTPGCCGCVKCYELPDHPHPDSLSTEAAEWWRIIITTAEKSLFGYKCFCNCSKELIHYKSLS